MKDKFPTIGIMGCGWLGLPLGEHLARLGYTIKGSTTSETKLKRIASKGINPFLVRLKDNTIEGTITQFLEGVGTLIINIPPRLRKHPNKNHVEELKPLIYQVEKHAVKHVLYVSSTSVFKDETYFPTITHTTKPNGISPTAKQLIAIEEMLQNNSNFSTTIIRFGGLIDDERHPAKFLSGKMHLKNGDAPANLIHKDDCIGIITQIIQTKSWDISCNAVYPSHPTKQDYYTSYCDRNHLPEPQYDTNAISMGKYIDSSYLAQQLRYTFKKPI